MSLLFFDVFVVRFFAPTFDGFRNLVCCRSFRCYGGSSRGPGLCLVVPSLFTGIIRSHRFGSLEVVVVLGDDLRRYLRLRVFASSLRSGRLGLFRCPIVAADLDDM